jgi:hypothetical protein
MTATFILPKLAAQKYTETAPSAQSRHFLLKNLKHGNTQLKIVIGKYYYKISLKFTLKKSISFNPQEPQS